MVSRKTTKRPKQLLKVWTMWKHSQGNIPSLPTADATEQTLTRHWPSSNIPQITFIINNSNNDNNNINNNNKSQAELKTFYFFHNHQQQHSQKTFTQERQQQHEEGHHNSNNDINKNNNNKIFRSMLESGLHLRVHRLCQTWKQGRGTCSVQDSEALKVLFRSL